MAAGLIVDSRSVPQLGRKRPLFLLRRTAACLGDFACFRRFAPFEPGVAGQRMTKIEPRLTPIVDPARRSCPGRRLHVIRPRPSIPWQSWNGEEHCVGMDHPTGSSVIAPEHQSLAPTKWSGRPGDGEPNRMRPCRQVNASIRSGPSRYPPGHTVKRLPGIRNSPGVGASEPTKALSTSTLDPAPSPVMEFPGHRVAAEGRSSPRKWIAACRGLNGQPTEMGQMGTDRDLPGHALTPARILDLVIHCR